MSFFCATCIIYVSSSYATQLLFQWNHAVERYGLKTTCLAWPANKNQHSLYPNLTVDSLIDYISRGWNSQVLRALVNPHDVKIIESIPLSRDQMVDREGWHFTNNGKFTVKSWYQVERIYPDRERPPSLIGPTVDVLKAFCWKIQCPLKIKYFLRQLVTGCVGVKKNLQARGMQGDIWCARCGADEESINHVFFECPPALRVWALSKIPTNQSFSQQVLSSQTWIIFSREFLLEGALLTTPLPLIQWKHRWRTISLHGYYGTFGIEEIIKFLETWKWILGTPLNWHQRNLHSGLRHIFWMNRRWYHM